MRKILLLLSLTLLTLSCSTDESNQRLNQNCYNSQYNYEQISFEDRWQGEFYRHENGVEILPRVVITENNMTVYLENGEVREYCKAVQMGQNYGQNSLRLTEDEYLGMIYWSTNAFYISIHNNEGDIFNYLFAKR